jgi:hypothetical protein
MAERRRPGTLPEDFDFVLHGEAFLTQNLLRYAEHCLWFQHGSFDLIAVMIYHSFL